MDVDKDDVGPLLDDRGHRLLDRTGVAGDLEVAAIMTRHPADLVSLTFGLLFATIGVVLLFGTIETLRLDWIAPAVTIILGVLLIAVARSRRTPPDDQPIEG